MGWTSMHRPKGITNEEFFLAEYRKGDPNARIHACGTVGGVFYAAMETKAFPGEVWGLVVLTQWSPNDHYNFSFKEMGESAGPYFTDAPLNVLRALTPTDNERALGWRDAGFLYHEQRKALRGLRDGDKVTLGSALTFTSGAVLDTFTIRRLRNRGGKSTRVVLADADGYGYYRVKNWQDAVVSVERDGVETETPLGVRRPENEYVRAVRALAYKPEHRDALKARYGIEDYSGDLEWRARLEWRAGRDLVDVEALTAAAA